MSKSTTLLLALTAITVTAITPVQDATACSPPIELSHTVEITEGKATLEAINCIQMERSVFSPNQLNVEHTCDDATFTIEIVNCEDCNNTESQTYTMSGRQSRHLGAFPSESIENTGNYTAQFRWTHKVNNDDTTNEGLITVVWTRLQQNNMPISQVACGEMMNDGPFGCSAASSYGNTSTIGLSLFTMIGLITLRRRKRD